MVAVLSRSHAPHLESCQQKCVSYEKHKNKKQKHRHWCQIQSPTVSDNGITAMSGDLQWSPILRLHPPFGNDTTRQRIIDFNHSLQIGLFSHFRNLQNQRVPTLYCIGPKALQNMTFSDEKIANRWNNERPKWTYSRYLGKRFNRFWSFLVSEFRLYYYFMLQTSPCLDFLSRAPGEPTPALKKSRLESSINGQ